MSAQVHALRDLLAARFPGATPLVQGTTPVAASGVAALDRILPGGGFPRGRLAVWSGFGAAALLRAACGAAAARGERAVWIDATGRTDARLGEGDVLLARPASALQAAECAEELARSGAFGLVVLAGAPAEEAVRLRLSRAVREGGAALVELGSAFFLAGLRLASSLLPAAARWRADRLGEPVDVEAVPVRVEAAALGWRRETTLMLPLAARVARLSLEPALADRRGAAR